MQKQIPAPAHNPPGPAPAGPPRRPRRNKARGPRLFGWRVHWGLLLGSIGVFLVGTCGALGLAGVLIFSAGRVPPGVSVLGTDIGLMTREDALVRLNSALGDLRLRDQNRVWTLDAAELGIRMDTAATVQRALDVGIGGVLGVSSVRPVLSVNDATLAAALGGLQPQVGLPPRNAGVRLVDGQVQAIPAAPGRALDVEATAAALLQNPAAALADGTLELVMRGVPPAVPDAEPLVAQAQGLLASSLRVRAYEPFEDKTRTWQASPAQWAAWVTAEPAPNEPLGLRLALDPNALAAFLEAEAAALPAHQFIDVDEAVQDIQVALANFDTNPQVRIYESTRTHTVQAGETITSIAWNYGIPYPYIEDANPALAGLNPGQQLTIPSREVFLEREIIPGKRIIVSMGGNWTKVYEDGALKWDWTSSTGINDSPTWPGVYQILSHEENAYAGNWNLYMPWFLGVYKPIPGSGFTNGFHGFPTRGGGQLLWENSLGTRVTYGCILLSNTNARLLYDWAEDGVIVEIVP